MQNEQTSQNNQLPNNEQPMPAPQNPETQVPVPPQAFASPNQIDYSQQTQTVVPPQQFPQPQPIPQQASTMSHDPGHSSPGLIVLQWLTYAFWGWALIGISSIIGVIIADLFGGSNSGEFVIYALAATSVLLPAAYVCDTYYSRREPVKKTGAAVAVMIIHAVIFALIAIGSVITAVFTIVSMLVSSGSNSTRAPVLISALIISLFYGAAFLRTLNPQKIPNIPKYYRYGMLASVIILGIAGIFGPIAKEFSLKDDKLIVNNIGHLSESINDYVEDKDQLPSSLDDLDLDGDTKVLVDKGVVDYKPEGKARDTDMERISAYKDRSSISRMDTYRYQLCVNYKEESSNYSSRYDRSDDYKSFISAYSHPKGEVCYKLQSTVY